MKIIPRLMKLWACLSIVLVLGVIAFLFLFVLIQGFDAISWEFLTQPPRGAVLGEEPVYTNTMHHQCVKEPGKGLKLVAQTDDGVPEALESEDGQIMLVQWHPEALLETEPRMCRLFEDLIERCRGEQQ